MLKYHKRTRSIMTIPYAFHQVFESGKVVQLEKEGRSPKEQAQFLMDGGMKGRLLGACLDSCRWGSQTGVMYEMNTRGMACLVKSWIDQNPDGIPDLVHEKDVHEFYAGMRLPLKDGERELPLETVVRRLNQFPEMREVSCDYARLAISWMQKKQMHEIPPCKDPLHEFTCPGHYEPTNKLVFPFDGWELAGYVQLWHEQRDSPFFE